MNAMVVIDYNFEIPQLMTFQEEYYTMPTMAMIGSIGGTLGMLVEFSFFGAIIEMAELIIVLLRKCAKKGKSISYSELQNCWTEGLF